MAKEFKLWREESKGNWGTHLDPGTSLSLDTVVAGGILRIADATEKMAGNYIFLQNERDKYERWYKKEREDNARMARRIAALQGVITKLKKSKEAK